MSKETNTVVGSSDNDNVSYVAEEDQLIVIDKDEYEELVSSSLFLDALESAGVENWDGYALARDIFGAFGK